MEVEGAFPTQGMEVELGSIRMTWAAAEMNSSGLCPHGSGKHK